MRETRYTDTENLELPWCQLPVLSLVAPYIATMTTAGTTSDDKDGTI